MTKHMQVRASRGIVGAGASMRDGAQGCPHNLARLRGSGAWRRVLATIVVAASGAFCANAEAGALDQLKAFTTNTKSARGEFTQKLERGGAPARSQSGSFAFSRPGKFRWSYARPFEQLLVADGQKLWIYDKDLSQVTVRKLGSALGDSPAAILFGSNDLERNFTLKETGERDGLEWLDATPKLKDSSFERVSIGFRDGLPEAMELRDAFGQVSRLSFGKIERNPPLAADTFTFAPPKGAEVLEQ